MAIPPAPLTQAFFERDVDVVARALIGAELTFDGAGGRIVETESYDPADPASHSYGERLTPRNRVMFGPAGHAYVYFIYGMYWCLNVTCGKGRAVLIRALEPTVGLDEMRKRRKSASDDDRRLCAGPGRLCQALGITGAQDGLSLLAPPFALTRRRARAAIVTGPRIGLTKGVEAMRRYGMKGSAYLSKGFKNESGA
ncbi:MAG: DNA-3-methyladenine glycosylase [Alphaproteobacteria bacterium]|nr:DNA-3-methyladenine glycosylase [Alphaproteobacteria bacterium]